MDPGKRPPLTSAKKIFILVTIALAIGAILYRFAHDVEWARYYPIYVIFPAAVAILIVVFLKEPTSAMGVIMKTLTLALLLSAVVLGEGIICILMAAPIIYLIGVLVGLPVEAWMKRRGKDDPNLKITFVPVAILVFAELLGIGMYPTTETVNKSVTVDVPASMIEDRLSQFHDLSSKELPFYLSLGFPRPSFITSSSLKVGDEINVAFEKSEEGVAGSLLHARHWHSSQELLVLKITARTSNSVTYEIVSDKTPIASWIAWRQAKVSWSSVDDDKTEVNWSVSYDRRLAPSWYFGPWEKYGSKQAIEYLTNSLTAAE